MTALPAASAGRAGPGRTAGGTRNRRPRPAERTSPAITGQDVRAALAALSAEHRQVIVEIYYHRRSVAETADLLRVSPATVISRAHFALGQLPRALTAIAGCQVPSPHPPEPPPPAGPPRTADGPPARRGLAAIRT